MSELSQAIDRYIASLRLENASPHTLRNYQSDLRQFAEHFENPAQISAFDLREWLGILYDQGLSAVSIRRKLAAVRSLFHFMAREGTIAKNVARLVRTPKAPKKQPSRKSNPFSPGNLGATAGLSSSVSRCFQNAPSETRRLALMALKLTNHPFAP